MLDQSERHVGKMPISSVSLDLDREGLISGQPENRSASTCKLIFGAEADRGVFLTGLLPDDETCGEVVSAAIPDDRSGEPVRFRGVTK
jgi:hypothetical protein